MTQRDPRFDERSQFDLPQALRDDLVRLYGPDVPVPAEVDRAILGQARQRLVRHRRSRMVLRRVGVAAAAAACILLAVRLAGPWRGQPEGVGQAVVAERRSPASKADHPAQAEPQPATTAVAAASPPAESKDLDRNGRVDILDAFALARRIEQTSHPSGDWDVNNDGVVNHDDVEAVAMAAVSLNGGAM